MSNFSTTTSTKKAAQGSKHLVQARQGRNDEFYTHFADIQTECDHYAKFFRNKRILCPCDGTESNFLKYFADNFDKFGLASLTAIGFNPHGRGFQYVKYPGAPPQTSTLLLTGDFRSPEGCQALRQADIVVTNPPFSMLRSFFESILQYKKQFLLLGNLSTIMTKDIQHFVQNGQVRFGYFGCNVMEFTLSEQYQECQRSKVNPDGTITKFAKVSSICWATNLPVDKSLGHNLTVDYDPEEHKKYDGRADIDLIEVPELRMIPKNYYGIMSVPISFVLKWDPQQFDILGFSNGDFIRGNLSINGKNCFKRVFIKRC